MPVDAIANDVSPLTLSSPPVREGPKISVKKHLPVAASEDSDTGSSIASTLLLHLSPPDEGNEFSPADRVFDRVSKSNTVFM